MGKIPNWVDHRTAFRPDHIIEGYTDDMVGLGHPCSSGGHTWSLAVIDREQGKIGIVIAGGVIAEAPLDLVLRAVADKSAQKRGEALRVHAIHPEELTQSHLGSLRKIYGEDGAAQSTTLRNPQTWLLSAEERKSRKAFAPGDDPT